MAVTVAATGGIAPSGMRSGSVTVADTGGVAERDEIGVPAI